VEKTFATSAKAFSTHGGASSSPIGYECTLSDAAIQDFSATVILRGRLATSLMVFEMVIMISSQKLRDDLAAWGIFPTASTQRIYK
jgi:hypothetical protein